MHTALVPTHRQVKYASYRSNTGILTSPCIHTAPLMVLRRSGTTLPFHSTESVKLAGLVCVYNSITRVTRPTHASNH